MLQSLQRIQLQMLLKLLLEQYRQLKLVVLHHLVLQIKQFLYRELEIQEILKLI